MNIEETLPVKGVAAKIDWSRFVSLLRERFLEYTQGELASVVGVDPNTVAKWERGKNTPRRKSKRKLKELARKKGFSEVQWPKRDG